MLAIVFQVTLIAVACYLYLYLPLQADLLDLQVFQKAALAFSEGEQVYSRLFSVKAFDGQLFELPFLYPPVFLFFVSLIQLILPSLEAFKFFFCASSFLAFFGAAFLLIRLSSRWNLLWRQNWTRSILLFLLICFQPFYWNFMLGQVDVFVLLLVLAVLERAESKRYEQAAALLSLAVAIKMTPVLLFIWLLPFAPGRVLKATALTSLVLFILPVISSGGALVYSDFLLSLSSSAGASAMAEFVFNYSLLGVLNAELASPFRELLGMTYIALVLSICALVAERREDPAQRLASFSSLLICMLLISPILWFQHFVWAFPALLVLLQGKPHDEDERYKFLVIAMGTFLVISELNLIHYQSLAHAPQFTLVTQALPGIICLILLALIERRRADL